jgi:hypothetical protein
MDKPHTPEKAEKEPSSPVGPPDKDPAREEDPAREAEQAAEAKAEEIRASVQGKGEQGKSSLSFLPIDPEDGP